MMNKNTEMAKFISQYITKSDIYTAKIIGKISAIICKRRNELKMTQKEFAKYMEVSQGMISKWESADYNFTIESIAKISEKLGLVFEVDFKSECEYAFNSLQNEYNSLNYANQFKVSFNAENSMSA